jgi:O-acetylserine/cysteine efflux transporter
MMQFLDVSMPLTHFIIAALIVAIWGFNLIFIKIGVSEIPPLFLCFIRSFLASTPAIFFIKRPNASFRKVLCYGLAMFTLQFSFLFVGIREGISPGLASLVLQLQVFFTALFGFFFFRETIHKRLIFGAIIAFCGIGLVFAHLNAETTLSGLFLVLAAALSWAVGNAFSKWVGRVNMLSLVVWGNFIAWPPLLLLSFMIDGFEKISCVFECPTILSLTAILYVSYLATLFAFTAWSWLLHHHPLAKIAPFALLIPICAIAGSVLFLGEPLQSWKIIAASLVIMGLCVNLFGHRLKI